MKILKGIMSFIIVSCILVIVALVHMFDADTVTLTSALSQMAVFFFIGLFAFISYLSIEQCENDKEDWDELLKRKGEK